MPYIKRDPQRTGADRRTFLLEEPLGSVGGECDGPGELNFVVTAVICEYLRVEGLSYATINDIFGVLDAAAREFDARVVRDYERAKCEENGDCYDL